MTQAAFTSQYNQYFDKREVTIHCLNILFLVNLCFGVIYSICLLEVCLQPQSVERWGKGWDILKAISGVTDRSIHNAFSSITLTSRPYATTDLHFYLCYDIIRTDRHDQNKLILHLLVWLHEAVLQAHWCFELDACVQHNVYHVLHFR